MINTIWLLLIILGTFWAAAQGDVDIVTRAVMEQSSRAVTISFGLIGIMSFWLGMMKLAEKSGLLKVLAKILRPLAVRLYPEIPPESEAMGTIIMNMGANMLGLGNVATPLGLKAMAKMQELNENKDTASNAMCTFLAMNTSSIMLVPTLVIGIRLAAGSNNPTEIVGTTLIATLCSTVVALTVNAVMSRRTGS